MVANGADPLVLRELKDGGMEAFQMIAVIASIAKEHLVFVILLKTHLTSFLTDILDKTNYTSSISFYGSLYFFLLRLGILLLNAGDLFPG